jgi:hypothetical protein
MKTNQTTLFAEQDAALLRRYQKECQRDSAFRQPLQCRSGCGSMVEAVARGDCVFWVCPNGCVERHVGPTDAYTAYLWLVNRGVAVDLISSPPQERRECK